jgi:sulfide:quinone oxidoreductase
MQKILILGGGTAGTMAANQLRKKLPKQDWEITVVDQDDNHVYQPGLLLMPFGVYSPERLVRSRKTQFAKGVKLVKAEIEAVKASENLVSLFDKGDLEYDYLIIASGTTPRPDQTPGMDGDEFGKSIFEFYTLEGATALRDKLAKWQGGRLVVHITEMPIKCPVAPLEFSFLADSYFKKMGIRDKVEIVYVTPLEGAFTKPVASEALGGMLEERSIKIETDFVIERIDDGRKVLISMDEREVEFDLLVTIPLNMGADFIARSGLGNDLNYVKVDKETMLSTAHNNVFVLGDASDIPASKAGSVAHFAIDLFIENFQQHVAGQKMTHLFDGHANCYIESGNGKGLLIDFNYETQPLTGHFPLPKIGPFSLLKETRINHLGKLAFEWIYWNLLLPGRKLPVSTLMSMTGKILPKTN